MAEALAPIRERSTELEKNPAIVMDALEKGALRCSKIAAETMEEVRAKMGIGHPSLSAIT